MKNRFWRSRIAAAVCVLVGATASAGLSSGKQSAVVKGVHPREYTLDNGLRLLLVERHDQPSVSAGVFFNVGSVNDPRGKSGIAHLFEHMMFKGSKVIGTKDFQAESVYLKQIDELRARMNAEMDRMRIDKRRGKLTDVLDPKQWSADYTTMKQEYDELIEAQRTYMKDNELDQIYSTNGGAMLNAGTAEDITLYFVQLPSNKIELFFWLESDRMQGGIMREFYIERDNVREERRLSVESTPTGKLREAFEALFWQSHPYGVPVLGWASEVESITRDDLRDFYHIYYAPNNARVVLIGDFDSDKVIELAKRYFGRIPRGAKEPPLVMTEEPKPIAVRRLEGEADTNPRVSVRYHAVAIGHGDEAALDVLGGLLSGKSGRLYKRMVTQEESIIGEPGAANSSRKYAGFFEFSATIKEGHAPEEVEQMFMDEIDKLREGEISEYELQKVKNQVLASSVRRLKNNYWLMLQLGFYDVFLDWSYINESPKRMLAVTAEDVKRVVNEYLDPNTRTVAIYRTKKREATSSEDESDDLSVLFDALSAEDQELVMAAAGRIQESEDAARLKETVQRTEGALDSGQAPAERINMLKYMVAVMKARLAELEAANKESE